MTLDYFGGCGCPSASMSTIRQEVALYGNFLAALCGSSTYFIVFSGVYVTLPRKTRPKSTLIHRVNGLVNTMFDEDFTKA